jgi:hypothetical protein
MNRRCPSDNLTLISFDLILVKGNFMNEKRHEIRSAHVPVLLSSLCA